MVEQFIEEILKNKESAVLVFNKEEFTPRHQSVHLYRDELIQSADVKGDPWAQYYVGNVVCGDVIMMM